ncbi:MAG: adenylyltransferase/cytidyltransferase family protein, partial [Oscillospiraceae bacterium]|nr:adenylyltransferase/cytidyltransferase family protein [Oscillospiraceae bacterium]
MIIGYTAGAFDMFHIGHLNLLKSSKGMCDKLIVGVSTDDLIFETKGKHPVIPYSERIEIVRS